MTSQRCCVIGVCLLLMVAIQSVSQGQETSCQPCQKTFPEDYNYCPYCGRPLVKTAPTKDVITNTIGMKLKYIPPGEFMMGSPSSEEGRRDYDNDEGPQHRVRISGGFWMGVTEVTQGQYRSVMNAQPWSGKGHTQQSDNNAASYISWDDAVEFCRKLSQKEDKTYRLPTEAEWEYACRAGSSTRFSFGESDSVFGDYAWFEENAGDVGEKYAHQVGQKKPNAFGLYDMHGNVWECCNDWYDENYYSKSPSVDPQGPNTGPYRVIRGGSWDRRPRCCRSANRPHKGPSSSRRSGIGGFRIILDLE